MCHKDTTLVDKVMILYCQTKFDSSGNNISVLCEKPFLRLGNTYLGVNKKATF